MINSSVELPSLYFAAPLFSEAELAFNLQVAKKLDRWFDTYLPQRDGGLLVDLVRRGVRTEDAYKSVFDRDVAALKSCDVCLVVLDGRSIDEGVSFELGFAYSLGKLCVGLQTDSRRLLPLGNNPMIQCALNEVFPDSSTLLLWAEKYRFTLRSY